MNRITKIALTIIFTILSPFAVMWCAHFLTAKAINMQEIFNGEAFWVVTGFWWIIGGCVVIACAIGNVSGKSGDEDSKELESIERRMKYYEENMPKRKL